MCEPKPKKEFIQLPHSLHNETIDGRFYISDTILSGRYGAIYKGLDMAAQPHSPVLIKCIDIAELKSDFS